MSHVELIDTATIVIEHNLDVIKSADYIIDLGSEGGSGGGRVVAAGTPEEVVRAKRTSVKAASEVIQIVIDNPSVVCFPLKETNMIGGIYTIALAFFITAPPNPSHNDCLCISSETVKKYCTLERSGATPNEYLVNQEATARRDIQRQIQHSISADLAKDATARSSIETRDLKIKELDGKIVPSNQIGASTNNYQGIIKISEKTKIQIECLTLKGSEATVYVNQHFVRYVPDRKDGSPHEVITNIIHRETWVFSDQGWKVKFIEELERGPTFLDGKPYDPK